MLTYKTNGQILAYTADKAALYAMVSTRNGVEFVTVLLSTFEEVDRQQFDHMVYLNGVVKPFVDDSFVYIAVQGGQILKIDKFSNQLERVIDLGSMEIAAIIHKEMESNFYCVCGVPIRLGQKLTLTNLVCCSIAKEKGKKIIQSAILDGTFSGATYDEDLFLCISPRLYKINRKMLLQNFITLSMTGYYPPLVTESFVVCASSMGTLEIYHKSDLKFHARILLDKALGNPVYFAPDRLCVIGGSGIHTVDLNAAKGVLQARSFKENLRCVAKDNVVWAAINGRILCCDESSIKMVDVSKQDLSPDITISHDQLIAHDGNSFFRVEI